MVESDQEYIIQPKRHKKEKPIPSTGILFINPADYDRCVKSLDSRSWERRGLFHSNLLVSSECAGFVAGPTIGAPMAAMTLEKLIALGAREIVVFGWCGGLLPDDAIGDLVCVQNTWVGEGTSQYYGEHRDGRVDAQLLLELETLLDENNVSFRHGSCWSTDAPYRETRAMLRQLRKEHNIDSVDMEISALVSVATFRKVALAALFVVSDLPMAKEWRAGFKQKGFKHQVEAMIQLLLLKFFDRRKL